MSAIHGSQPVSRQLSRPHYILVVDDDPLVRETMAMQLECDGFVVTEADSGAHAIELLESGVPADVLLTDFSMPDLSGLQVIQIARGHRPGLRSVLLSGFAEDDALPPDSVPDDGFAFLHKPVPGAVLTGTIESLLNAVDG